MTITTVIFDAYGTLYDVQSVEGVIDEAYPGYGEVITQIWRLKQLEYTWLRSLMSRYEDFAQITHDSLQYALTVLGLRPDANTLKLIMDKYVHLDLYPDAKQSLERLKDFRLAILSNGSTAMLNELVCNTGLDTVLEATISVDAKKVFKPSPDAYSLVEANLSVKRSNVLFVSSNPFDACGAKAFGFSVAWIERISTDAMVLEWKNSGGLRPLTMFKAMRMQMDHLGFEPDYRIASLSALPALLAGMRVA
ncbi:haloacid dehalogenase type II [Tardiphaga sp. 1201_B9_N1_1]|uniref:haloacid dehalogenase type II n=1 Tax=unclassified Tardiphaga TaxID=2631404 RepID=UPI003F262584